MRDSMPRWLWDRLRRAGGSVPFRTFMMWALHDPDHGYYGAGRARIGPGGDFATSPSLGEEFSALLLPQLIEWLDQLPGERLSLVEAGPGEGQLASQLAKGLARSRPDLASRTELVLLEPNPGMVAIQREALQGAPLAIRWASWPDLQRDPLRGVVVAHEVLDALPVDRLLWDGVNWHWQHVACQAGELALVAGPPLTQEDWKLISALVEDGRKRPPGWCSEWHSGLAPWLLGCGQALREGVLLVIDYALEARRYYALSRDNGTLMAYRGQQARADPLLEPGEWDLTAHLCLESVRQAAKVNGWFCPGERRQGEALLALGLARRLAELGRSGGANLSETLRRREQLLRLVDPLATGDFRWLVFERHQPGSGGGEAGLRHRCLSDPPSMAEADQLAAD